MRRNEPLAVADTVPTISELPRCHLSRPRLVDLLSAKRGDVTALVAGAGYGKSVLLREWLDSFPGVAVVTRVDRPVSDSALVLRSLLGSLYEQTEGMRSRSVGELDRESTSDRRLENALIEEMRLLPASEVAIVVDDFHHVGGTDVVGVLEAVLRANPGARVVLAGRGDPSGWLRGWRLEGRLQELRQKDLAFTAEETRDLVQQVAGTDLDDPTSEMLRVKTQGWPAGVLLAALAMVGEDAPGEVVRTFAGSDQIVADYFLSRVLDQVTPDLRDFLLRVSVLEEVTVEAATEISGRADSGAVLRDLETRHLFVTRLPTGSFRFHPLFAELLRYELRTVDQQAFADSHRRAATHLQRIDDLHGVMQHLSAAGESDLLASFLADHVTELWRTLGEDEVVLWIDQLTDHVLRADPDRAPSLAVAVAATGSVQHALSYADRMLAHRTVRAKTELRLQLEWFRAVCVAALGDLDGATDSMARIRSEDPASVPTHPTSVIWRELPLAYLFADDWESFDREWRWGVERGLDHAMLPVGLAGVRGLVLARRGFIPSAREVVDAGLAVLAQEPVQKMSGISHLHAAAALVALEGGALIDAEHHATEAVALCGLFEPQVAFRVHAEAVRAEVVRRSGRPSEALALLRSAASSAGPNSVLRPYLRAILGETELLCACDVGDHASAREAFEHLVSPAAQQAGWARIQLRFGNRGAALDALPSTDELLWLAGDQPRRAVSLLALRARAAHGRMSVDGALHHAVAIASQHGLLGSLSSEGLDHHELIREADAEAARQLSVLDVRASSAEPLLDELSMREQELLRLLPTEMPNRQLAAELYISLNTLKTHLKAIYRKLAVESRAEAVRRARELRLLPPRDLVPTGWSGTEHPKRGITRTG